MKGGMDKFSKSFLFRDTQKKESEGSLKQEFQTLTLEELFGRSKEVQRMSDLLECRNVTWDTPLPIHPIPIAAKPQEEQAQGKACVEVQDETGEYVSNVVPIRPKTETRTFEWYAIRRARASECASAPVLAEGYQSFVVGVDGINYVVALV